MPLMDLEALGYDVFMPEEQPTRPTGPIVYGYGRSWSLPYDWGVDDEDRVVLEATNHKTLIDKLEAAQTYFAETYTNWPTLTAVQKDTASRNAMRALRNLIQNVRGDLTSGGS